MNFRTVYRALFRNITERYRRLKRAPHDINHIRPGPDFYESDDPETLGKFLREQGLGDYRVSPGDAFPCSEKDLLDPRFHDHIAEQLRENAPHARYRKEIRVGKDAIENREVIRDMEPLWSSADRQKFAERLVNEGYEQYVDPLHLPANQAATDAKKDEYAWVERPWGAGGYIA